jgi:hypothetical protein
MSVPIYRIASEWKKSIGALMLTAYLGGAGCANIGKKIDDAVGTIGTPSRAPTDGKTVVAGGSLDPSSGDYSANRAIAQEKFSKMLDDNGMTK